jgi:predicted GH43/DUF377 family glycosyl hydrolase
MPVKKTSHKKHLVGAEVRKKKVSSRVSLPPPPRKKVVAHKKPSVDGVLHRYKGNPIVEPKDRHVWESKATFNPGAFYANGKVHMLYRAIGDDDSSVLGYARLRDGYIVEERLVTPSFSRLKHREQRGVTFQIPYSSGGGWNGGCEDPRLTLIGDTVYMIYIAFDGWGSLRVSLTSIQLQDFLKKKWNWKKPVFISPPGQINKNWVLFPEKINGKFAVLHSFYPKILISYFDSLNELDGKTFIKSDNTRPVDMTRTWDSWFRGVGPTPIKTDKGWLILYHAMDHKNPDRYRVGALLLDIDDPTKILYRSAQPILEPDEIYENQGYKAGVVYACGAAVVDDELFVYYGGADKFTCVASAPLKPFLKELMSTGAPSLTKLPIQK